MRILILLLLVVCSTWNSYGQATDPGYELPKPLPTTGPTPPTVIKPGGSFAPTAYSDPRPGLYDIFVWGGHRSYGTLAERNAARWKKEGMLVYVAETTNTYQLASDLVTWTTPFAQPETIYTGDGTLDGDRIVHLGIRSLSFEGLSSLLRLNGGIEINSPFIKLKTAGVAAETRTTNQFLKLVNLDGTVEFADAAGIGGSSANGYTVGDAILTNSTIYRLFSPTPAYTTNAVYPDHFMVSMRTATANAGNESLAVGSGPAKSIRLTSGNLVPVGDIITNINYSLSFDSALDAFILMNPSSGLIPDSTLYAAVNGPQITLGVATNALPFNRLPQLPASTFIGNPTGSTANAIPIGLGSNLSFVGTNLVASSPGAPTVVTTSTDYTVAGGVGFVIANATSGNITITLPAASAQQDVTILKNDNVANMVNVVCAGADSFATGISNGPVRLFLRQETLRVRGIGSNLNVIVSSSSSDLGTVADMRNYTMLFRAEFADTTAASFWGQNGLSTVGYAADANHGYVSSLTTGAATNGMGYISLRGSSLALTATNPVVLSWSFQMPTLPTVAEYYVLEFGAATTVAATGTDLNDTDAVMFRYASEENGGKFRFRTTSNGIGNSTYINETTITPTASTWYLVTVFMSSERAWLIINNTVVGPFTTNIPTAATMTVVGRILKGIGTTPRLINLDYFKSARTATR